MRGDASSRRTSTSSNDWGAAKPGSRDVRGAGKRRSESTWLPDCDWLSLTRPMITQLWDSASSCSKTLNPPHISPKIVLARRLTGQWIRRRSGPKKKKTTTTTTQTTQNQQKQPQNLSSQL